MSAEIESALPLTPRVLRIVERAAAIAQRWGHGYVGTEHLQLAIIEVGGGVATYALEQVGCHDHLKDRIESFMKSPGYTGE